MRTRPHRRLTLIALLLLLTAAAGPATRPTTVPTFDAEAVGRSVVLLGRTGRPLGQVMTLMGVAVEGPFKGYEGGPNLIVQRIDGVAIQERIRLVVEAGTFDPLKPGEANDRFRPRFIVGKTYRLRGYEDGHFVGLPAAANPGGMVQTTGYHFQCTFSMNWGVEPERVPDVTFTPADFVDRPALLAGTAANADGVGWLVGPGWRLRSTDDGSPWPDWMVGKPAEVDGVIRGGHGTDYRSEHAARRLVRLADQIGHPVELRGTARQDVVAQQWWLDYRGDRVDVPGLAALPGWQPAFEYEPVILRGTLTRPTIKGPAEDGDPYVLRDVTWSPLPALRANERSPADDN